MWVKRNGRPRPHNVSHSSTHSQLATQHTAHSEKSKVKKRQSKRGEVRSICAYPPASTMPKGEQLLSNSSLVACLGWFNFNGDWFKQIVLEWYLLSTIAFRTFVVEKSVSIMHVVAQGIFLSIRAIRRPLSWRGGVWCNNWKWKKHV